MWIKAQKVYEDDNAETVQYKELMNHTLLDRQPYFFKFRYPQAKKDFYVYEDRKQSACKALYNRTIKQLEETPRKTREQKKWLMDYYHYAPLILGHSPMNAVCEYIESVDFGIMREIKEDTSFDPTIYMGDVDIPEDVYQEIVACYREHVRDMYALRKTADEEEVARLRGVDAELLREKLRHVCFDNQVVTAALVKYLYIENPTAKKTLLWEAYGKTMVKSLLVESQRLLVPVPSDEKDIEYLGRYYTTQEVDLDA